MQCRGAVPRISHYIFFAQPTIHSRPHGIQWSQTVVTGGTYGSMNRKAHMHMHPEIQQKKKHHDPCIRDLGPFMRDIGDLQIVDTYTV